MTSILLAPADLGSALAKQLEQLGVRVVTWPEIKIDEPDNYSRLDDALENLFGYDWLVLKNERAAASFLRRLENSHELNELDDLKTLAIGDSTSEILVGSHTHVDVAIDRFPSENVFAALKDYAGDLGGLTVLLPSAGLHGESFEQQLVEAGARVDNVAAYRTTSDNQRLAHLMALLVGGGIDSAIFTNSSALDEFSRLVDSDDLPRILTGVELVCSDSETARVARDRGLAANTIMPEQLSGEALAKLLNMHR